MFKIYNENLLLPDLVVTFFLFFYLSKAEWKDGRWGEREIGGFSASSSELETSMYDIMGSSYLTKGNLFYAGLQVSFHKIWLSSSVFENVMEYIPFIST